MSGEASMMRKIRRWLDVLHYRFGLCGDLYCPKCKALWNEERAWN